MISFRENLVTDGRLREWITLEKHSVQLIPAYGKQSDNTGRTNGGTGIGRVG